MTPFAAFLCDLAINWFSNGEVRDLAIIAQEAQLIFDRDVIDIREWFTQMRDVDRYLFMSVLVPYREFCGNFNAYRDLVESP